MHKYVKNIILVLAIPILTLGISAQIANATAHTITGTVRDPANNSVSGVYVHATDPMSEAILYGPVLTNVNGYYSLPIAVSGTYNIHFTPPTNKVWAAVVESNVVVSASQTLNRNFASHTNVLSGTLKTGSGNPITGATVRIGAYTSSSDANGNYSITAPAASYPLSVVGGTTGVSFSLQQSTNGINLLNGSQSLDITIKTVQMTVQPRNNVGGGLYSEVSARATSGTTQLYPGDPGTNITIANSTTVTPPVAYGPATVTTIMGAAYTASGMESTSNTTSVCTKVPVSSVYDCLRVPLTAKTDIAFDVPSSSPAVRTFSGTLTDGNGTPIPTAQITLVRYGDTTPADTTDANGQFSITAAPKQYSMKVYTNNGPVPSLQLTQPAATPGINLTMGDLVQNLQIPTATLTVSVLDSWGGPAYNAPVYAQGNKGTAYLYTGAVGSTILAAGETKTTSASSNVVTFNAVVGAQYDAKGLNTSSAVGSICADIGANWNCIGTPLTVSGNTSVTVSQ